MIAHNKTTFRTPMAGCCLEPAGDILDDIARFEGGNARRTGLARVPGHDPDLVRLAKAAAEDGREQLSMIEAWLDGWDAANATNA